jgi:hypothetical protein
MLATHRLSRFCCTLLLCTALCSFAASCDPNNKAADAGVNFTAGKSATNGKLGDDMPTPPADAQYTILCRDFPEPTHVQDSRDAQHVLLETTKMNKWYIVHASDHSTLYYGFYRTIDQRDPKDGAEGKRAIDDLNAIRTITTPDGTRLFSASLPVGIDTPDPEANPAWDITKSTGYWSIEIAAFANSPDRKQRAVQAVRDARADGVEAYYYHSPTASSVCIGSWPKEAAIEITPADMNTDQDRPLFVTNTPIDPAVEREYQKQNIQTAYTHVDIRDLTLTSTLAKYPDHSVNGFSMHERDPLTGAQTDKVIEHSFLFKIPHKDPLDTIATPTAPIAPPPTQHNDQPGVGHLRSLGD